ncbi:MAG TPA: AMP-binding protein, partial [Pseudogulbenkiania sp.]|nr:AMP-binding protein [Pseudogulbenkiania sp.]
MQDYSAAVSQFNYHTTVRQVLAGDLDALNACIECCDRYAGTEHVALYYEGSDGNSASYTFSQLKEYSARFANWLQAQGVRPGDTVAGLLPRTVELLITILGTWRLGAVYQPLFTAFGPKAIEHRLGTSGARVVVTNGANRAKLNTLEGSAAVLTVGAHERDDVDFWEALRAHSAEFEPILRGGDDPFLLMFTSGTTGLAKPIEVPLKAIVAFVTYMRDAIGLTAQDRFWNLADPGWAYGLYYAVTGPLALGLPTTFYDGPFSVESTCRIIRKLGITNLAGSPTAYRLLIAGGEGPVRQLRGVLRVVSSAGEPLNPEVIRWFDDMLGVPIHDHYGQTELGMV